jgi:beta-xylosidase
MKFLVRQRFLLAFVSLGLGLFSARAQMQFYGDYYLHDPGTMIKDGNNYFIYGDGQGIDGITSTDLRNWNAAPVVFPNGPPAWTSNSVPGFTGYFWAPDIAYFNGRYNLYYACSEWGTINSAIGLVTSPSLTSPVWTDQGKVIQSNPDFATNATTDLTAYNCIDPSIMVDTNGTVWLSFGSYSDGILIMQLDPATGKRISPDSTIYRVSNNGPVFFSNTEEGSCLYQHGGYYYLFVNFGGCCDGVDSTYNIRVGRSTSVTGPYYDKNGVNMVNGGGTMVLESTARYIGPGHAAIMNDNGTNWFTFHYYDGLNSGVATVGMNRLYWTADGWPSVTNDWSALYTFNTDAREHLGLYNGTLQNHAAITNDSALGNVLNLNGVNNYVSLPLSMANASTFAAWVKWKGGADWQRIFDFGNDTTNYFFLTPQAYGGNMRFAITTNGNGTEQQINAPSALPTNSWIHVAVTLDGSKGILYLDGAPVATNSALTIRPWQLLAKNNYIGKSEFSADPFFNGEIASFRIFGRALSASEIKDIAYANPALAHRYSFNTNSFLPAWDSIGMAHGTLVGDAVVTNNALVLDGTTGSFVSLPGGLVSGSSAVTLEFWATFGSNGNWARVVDFGDISGSSGQDYFFFSPHNGGGGQTMEMKTNSTTTFNISGTFDNRTLHIVCIVDPTNNYAAVYTNGVLEQTMTAAWPKFSSVSTAWSFIGRSLFSSDAYLNATIDELRIYDGRLTPEEIAADYKFGPDALAIPINLVESNLPSGLNFTWPSYAAGFVLETTPVLGNMDWTPVAAVPSLNNDQWQVAIPTTNSAQFFRLRR